MKTLREKLNQAYEGMTDDEIERCNGLITLICLKGFLSKDTEIPKGSKSRILEAFNKEIELIKETPIFLKMNTKNQIKQELISIRNSIDNLDSERIISTNSFLRARLSRAYVALVDAEQELNIIQD